MMPEIEGREQEEREGSLRVAEIVGEGLQAVRRELVFVPQDVVVSGTARALETQARSFSTHRKRAKRESQRESERGRGELTWMPAWLHR